jgi:hypothetical protein
MYAVFNGIFVGAEPEQTIEKGSSTYRVQNASFQELDESLKPIPGRYLVVEVWNQNLESLKGFKIGDRMAIDVEVITRRKLDKPERYRTRITYVGHNEISERTEWDELIIN